MSALRHPNEPDYKKVQGNSLKALRTWMPQQVGREADATDEEACLKKLDELWVDVNWIHWNQVIQVCRLAAQYVVDLRLATDNPDPVAKVEATAPVTPPKSKKVPAPKPAGTADMKEAPVDKAIKIE